MKIVTHDSIFHTDDTFAVATLLLKFPDAEVIRSRDKGVQATADILVDTGMTYDPTKNHFDHHMPEGAGERGNGIPYASFGLVWKEFGEELALGKREAEIIDQKLVQPIDAHDNGVAIAEYKFSGVREYAIGDFLYSYLASGEDDAEVLYTIFMQNVRMAQELLSREIKRAKETALGEEEVKRAYNNAQDKRLIEITNSDQPWKLVLGSLPEPLYALYRRKDGNWGVGAVPDLSKPFGFNRKDLPAQWGGKTDKELQEVSGVSSAVFAHRKLFMAVAKTREGALALAKKALDA